MSDSEEPQKKKICYEKRVIVILENAPLETVKVGKDYQLLDGDKHKHLSKKYKKDMSMYRPDITHQCLLMLFDSPLNRENLLQVYIRTCNNILIEINPQTRIPRTFDRFCGLMVQLLKDFSIKAAGGSVKLLKVIKNPITDHLPPGCLKITTSFAADETLNPADLSKNDMPIVFVVGAFAKGSVDVDYTEKTVSFSKYPLSAALTCSKLCNSFEQKWGIL